MEISPIIVSRNFELTDALHSYIIKKLTFLERFSKYIEKVSIEITDTKLGGENISYIVDINVIHEVLRVEEKGTDLYRLIDMAHDRIKGQLEKYKDKITAKEKVPMSAIIDKEMDHIHDINEGLIEDAALMESDFKITISKHVVYSDNRPLHTEEAVTQMEILGHNSFLFKNIDNGKYSMVFKLDDGTYGLTEPENE